MRNWRIGAELAERLDAPGFELINLTQSAAESSARAFADSLNRDGRRSFRHLTWGALLERLPGEPWLAKYAAERRLSHGA